MGVVTFKSKFSVLNIDNTFRIDYKYISFLNNGGWNLFKSNSKNTIPLKEILIPFYENYEFEDDVEYFGVPTGKDYLDQFGEIISTQLITKEEHPSRLKYKVDSDCVLISSLKGARIPALSFDIDLSSHVFSNAFYVFKINRNWSKKFVLHLLRTEKIKNIIDNDIYRGIGISAYKEEDLLKVLIPKIDYQKQLKIVELIEPIETEITNLKNSKLKPLDIINRVFGEEFGFDWEAFEKLKKQKIYSSNLNEFANNIDCRMGLKFHNLAGKYLHAFLVSKTIKKVKDFIVEPIALGKSVSPSDYDEEGEFFYIAMSNIKTYAFEPEDCKKVSENYSKNNLKKTVQKGDILLARSGEGTIGKVALIDDEDVNAVFADFTQRIRLDNYKSEFFQYLVYTHKKGLGNNTNIFPSQIREFPIPDWDDIKQTEIIEKIKMQIDVQNIIDRQIEQKQQQINDIIESAIKTE
jgi:hypothetical protein